MFAGRFLLVKEKFLCSPQITERAKLATSLLIEGPAKAAEAGAPAATVTKNVETRPVRKESLLEDRVANGVLESQVEGQLRRVGRLCAGKNQVGTAFAVD